LTDQELQRYGKGFQPPVSQHIAQHHHMIFNEDALLQIRKPHPTGVCQAFVKQGGGWQLPKMLGSSTPGKSTMDHGALKSQLVT